MCFLFIRRLTWSMNCLGCFVFPACGFVERMVNKAKIICAGKRVHPMVSLICASWHKIQKDWQYNTLSKILQIWQKNRSRAHSIAERLKVQEAHKERHYSSISHSSKSWWLWEIMGLCIHSHIYFLLSYRMNMWSM